MCAFAGITCGGDREAKPVPLGEWATRLERCEMLLQVLGNDDRELVFDDAERARIDTFLSDQAAAQEQMGAEWEASRRQAQVWREELAATAQKQVARERAFSPQQVGGGGDESDSESDSCPTCPRCTSESVSWDRDPSNGGQCYDCGYRISF